MMQPRPWHWYRISTADIDGAAARACSSCDHSLAHSTSCQPHCLNKFCLPFIVPLFKEVEDRDIRQRRDRDCQRLPEHTFELCQKNHTLNILVFSSQSGLFRIPWIGDLLQSLFLFKICDRWVNSRLIVSSLSYCLMAKLPQCLFTRWAQVFLVFFTPFIPYNALISVFWFTDGAAWIFTMITLFLPPRYKYSCWSTWQQALW